MKDQLDRIRRIAGSLQSRAGRPLWAAALLVLGILLLGFGAVRTASGVRERASLTTEIGRLTDKAADLEDAAIAVSGENRQAADTTLEGVLPRGEVPGPILEAVLAALDSAQIHDFEYHVRERSRTVDAADPDDERGDGERGDGERGEFGERGERGERGEYDDLGDAEADSDARDFDSDGRGADEYDSDARDYDSDGDGSDDYDSNARDYDSNARDYDSDGGGSDDYDSDARDFDSDGGGSDDYDSDTGDYDSDVNGRSNPGGYGKESGAHESRRGREARVTGAKVWNEADWDRTGRNQEGGESAGWQDDRPAESRPEFTPGASLYHWKVDLVLRTEYGRVVDLLTALAESRRHWRVSELSLERSGGSIEARLLLETFTHPGSGGEGPQEFGPLASEDPFRISIQEARRQAIPVAPALRAVVSGRVPRAWIGGEIATTGDTVADWTVEVIDDDGVWIRHATGQRVRLSVGG